MTCPICSADLETGARFCGVCGHRLVDPRAGDQAGRAETVPASSPGVPGAGQGAPARPSSRPAPTPGDPYIGVVLNDRFRVDAKLGEGGFGSVYRGTQEGTGRQVALKLLHPEMARDRNLVARFRREGLVMCNLRDAHSITTYDFDQTSDGTLYIAMELLEGQSLHEVFHAEAPLAWQRVFRVLEQMCSSLAEAHAQGIVHRDLKPENIVLENRPGNPEFVKVLDFGIAKVIHGESGQDKNSPQLTATGQTLGTLEYMSPEQLMGKQLDGRSDVYALGVLAYEMTTGRLPFPDAKGPAGLITAQLRDVPEPPSRANPGGNIPRAVDATIAKMLEKDKKNRFDDVQILGNVCRALLATEGRSGGPAIDAELGAGPPGDRQGTVLERPSPGAPRPPEGPPPSPGPPAAARRPASTTDSVIAATTGGSRAWLWVVLAIIAVGGAVGAALALT